MQHSNTSIKSGKIKSISSSGQATMSGLHLPWILVPLFTPAFHYSPSHLIRELISGTITIIISPVHPPIFTTQTASSGINSTRYLNLKIHFIHSRSQSYHLMATTMSGRNPSYLFFLKLVITFLHLVQIIKLDRMLLYGVIWSLSMKYIRLNEGDISLLKSSPINSQ